jgi:PAS domain S-box-containing protein
MLFAKTEAVRRHRDGTHINVEVSACPILNDQGTLVGLTVIMRDIRERRRLELENRFLRQAVAQGSRCRVP